MKELKFSINDIKSKLTRSQMRDILGGSGDGGWKSCKNSLDCSNGYKCCITAAGVYKCMPPEDCAR